MWEAIKRHPQPKSTCFTRKAVRLITSVNYLATTPNLFFNLNMLTVFDFYQLQLAVFMYNHQTHDLPQSIFRKLTIIRHYIQKTTIPSYSNLKVQHTNAKRIMKLLQYCNLLLLFICHYSNIAKCKRLLKNAITPLQFF